MRAGLACFLAPSSTAGVNGGRYTFQQLAQNATYASVFKRIDGLSGTYADGARMYLPPAIEAAETMLSPEQTAKLCNDSFSRIGDTAFQAFEQYPEIFRAARERLRPNHILSILEKLTRRSSNTLPFHDLAKAIKGLEGLSSKQIADLIGTGIHADGALTCRIVDRLAPVYNSARSRFTSDEEAIRFFRLTKERFGKRADKIVRAAPALLAGIEGKYVPEQILDAITRPNIPGLSPTGNAIISLCRILLFKQGSLNPDLAVEALIEMLRKEGDKARRSDLPTVGGKISGYSADFNKTYFDYLDMLGFECRRAILFRDWSEACERRDAMMVLPAARSAFETTLLIDMLRDVGVFRDGAILRHQITVAGRLIEEAKYIELALHSAKPIPIPYPDMLMSPIQGFVHIAPVVGGGWEMMDINKKGPWFNYRFDLALMSIYSLTDERRVLQNALARSDDGQSLMELMLAGMYKLFEAKWKMKPENMRPERASDDTDIALLHTNGERDAFIIRQRIRPDVVGEYFEALEGLYGEGLVAIRDNHEFNIYATQLLAWAMKSPWRSEPRGVYKRFMAGMQDLYRERGIESTLKTRWLRREWKQIYPSLSQLDAIKDPEFHQAIRMLVIKTVKELQKMV